MWIENSACCQLVLSDAGQKGKSVGEARVGASTVNGLCQLLPCDPDCLANRDLDAAGRIRVVSDQNSVGTCSRLMALIQFGNPILNKSTKSASPKC